MIWGLIRTSNFVSDSLFLRELKSHFRIGIRERIGTPEPVFSLDDSSNPPNNIISSFLILIWDINLTWDVSTWWEKLATEEYVDNNLWWDTWLTCEYINDEVNNWNITKYCSSWYTLVSCDGYKVTFDDNGTYYESTYNKTLYSDHCRASGSSSWWTAIKMTCCK